MGVKIGESESEEEEEVTISSLTIEINEGKPCEDSLH